MRRGSGGRADQGRPASPTTVAGDRQARLPDTGAPPRVLAGEGPRRRRGGARADRRAGPGRHRLCGGGGSAGGHRAVCDGRRARHVLPDRAVADPRVRPGFGAPAARRDGRGAARCRRRPAGGRTGRRAVDHGRGARAGCRGRAPGVRDRPAVATDPGRLHERDRPDDPGRPAAEAAGVLGRSPRRGGWPRRPRRGSRRWRARAARDRHRRPVPRGHPGPEARRRRSFRACSSR